MKRGSQEKNSRRKFLSLGMFGEAGLNNQSPDLPDLSTNRDETVPMLTADGKLVEVSKSLMEKLKREKATNRDIMNWSKPLKNSKLP